MLLEIVIGLIIALTCIFIVQRIYPKKDHAFWRIGLIMAALVYVGFALFGGYTNYLPLELGGVVLYGLFAFLSKKHTLYWLALGWGLHIAWDVFLHGGASTPFVPHWYPGLCIGFDIAIALYLIYLISKREKRQTV